MKTRRILLGFLAFFLVIQVIPVDRSNPPEGERLQAPPAVEEILRRSCIDCHSNRTHWPWYAYVAPTSWLVAHDVEEGREHLNFSTWEIYDEDERVDLFEEIAEVIEDGEMPLWFYIPLHPDAQLSDNDSATLIRWAKEAADR